MNGKIFKIFRKKHNLTQSELSKILGCNSSYIGQIESNIRPPSCSIMMHLADLLNLTNQQIEDIINPNEENKKIKSISFEAYLGEADPDIKLFLNKGGCALCHHFDKVIVGPFLKKELPEFIPSKDKFIVKKYLFMMIEIDDELREI